MKCLSGWPTESWILVHHFFFVQHPIANFDCTIQKAHVKNFLISPLYFWYSHRMWVRKSHIQMCASVRDISHQCGYQEICTIRKPSMWGPSNNTFALTIDCWMKNWWSGLLQVFALAWFEVRIFDIVYDMGLWKLWLSNHEALLAYWCSAASWMW